MIEDRTAVEHDVLTIDFVGKIDGETFEGGIGENYPLELGSHTFIPGFEEQLIGVKVGEVKNVTVKFPQIITLRIWRGKRPFLRLQLKKLNVRISSFR